MGGGMPNLFDSCLEYLKDQAFDRKKKPQSDNTPLGVKAIDADVLATTITNDCNNKISEAMMNAIAEIERKIPEFTKDKDRFLGKVTEIKDQMINVLSLSLKGVVGLLQHYKGTSQQDTSLWNIHVKEVILDSAVKFFKQMPQEALELEKLFHDIHGMQKIQDIKDKFYEFQAIMRGFEVKMIPSTPKNNREKDVIGSSRVSFASLENAFTTKIADTKGIRPLPEQTGRERRIMYGYNLWEKVKEKNLEKKQAQKVITKAKKLNTPKP
jgi:hypothetical protein